MSSKQIFKYEYFVNEILNNFKYSGIKIGLNEFFSNLSKQTLLSDYDLFKEAWPNLQSYLLKISSNIKNQVNLIEVQYELDKTCLSKEFGDLGKIKDIIGPKSDLHELHSSVYFIIFEKRILVYKPRKLIIDKVFFDLTDHYLLNNKIKFVLRENYGWMEYVSPDNSPNICPKKLGHKIAILSILRSSDHHSENIIYSHGDPYFIDLECSLVPEMTFANRTNKIFSPYATRAILEFPKSSFYQVQKGLFETLAVIEKEKKFFRNSIESIGNEKMRIVLRQTSYYQELILASFNPHLLIEPVFRFKRIKKHLLNEAGGFNDLANYEAQCICDGIIPKFFYQPKSKIINGGKFKFKNLITECGYDLALQTLECNLLNIFKF